MSFEMKIVGMSEQILLLKLILKFDGKDFHRKC